MKCSVRFWILVFACVFWTSTAQGQTGLLVKVTDSVYSYLGVKEAAPANSFGANAGIVIGGKGIAVIDTLVSAKEAKRFIRDIRKISAKPILYVINTHYHLDHSFGNSEFDRLGASIIAHKNCAAEMRSKAVDGLANAKEYGLSPEDTAGTEIVYPGITFTNRMQIDLGGVEINLIHVSPSHSKGSILVQIPSEKVVFTGDILFTDFHPYMADGDIEGWQQTLDFLTTIDAEKLIPGHGPLSNKKDVADMKTYIVAFDQKAKELTARQPNELADIVAEMKKNLPNKSQGEWIIGANIQARYLKGENAEKN